MEANLIRETENAAEPSFEANMKRLEEIVGALEKGEASLSESMRLFTEGTELIRRCSEMLDTAEQQVAVLRQGADGKPEEAPFDL